MREQLDSQLVDLAQAGDAEAYGQLFERYQSKIYNFAYSILGHAEDARDVTQDAFIRVFEALPGKSELEFQPYVYRTTRNLAYDIARTRGRFTGDSESALDTQVEPALEADPEGSSLFREQTAKVRAAITALPDDYRAVLTLREIDEMSYQQIADSLGMPRNTVGVMISRARLKFRGAFRMQYVDANRLAEECKGMLPKLSAYIDGELKPAEVAAVDEHLEGCPLCRLAVDEMREATKSYRAFIPLLPPIALKADVFSRLSQLEVWPGADGGGSASGSAGDGSGEGGGQGTEGATHGSGTSPVGSESGGPRAAEQASSGEGAADGLGSGGPDTAEDPVVPQAAKSLSLKKALKSPAVWIGLSLLVLLLFAGGIGLATGWGQNGRGATGQVSTAPEPPVVLAVSAEATLPAPAPAIIESDVVSELQLKDVEAPPTPDRTSPGDGALVSSDNVRLRWRAVEDPSGVRYGVEVQQWVGGGEGWQGLSADTLDATHYHSEVPIKIRWRVWAVDKAGNRSGKTSWWSVVRAADNGGSQAAPSKPPTATTAPAPRRAVPVVPFYPLR